MQEIVRLADTLVLMSHGRIEAVGPLEELTSRLELRPLTGRYDAVAGVTATVAGPDQMFGLTALRFPRGRPHVPPPKHGHSWRGGRGVQDGETPGGAGALKKKD